MNHRPWLRLRIGLAAVGVLGILAVAGCEQGRRALRAGSEPALTEAGPIDLDAVGRSGDAIELPPDDVKGFFKPGRLSGAWSREAAEIEESLGVPR